MATKRKTMPGNWDKPWTRCTARSIKVGDRIIRNVQKGFEWSPGPYGAFIVHHIKWSGDEVTFTAYDSSGCTADPVKFGYDGEEEVTVQR